MTGDLTFAVAAQRSGPPTRGVCPLCGEPTQGRVVLQLFKKGKGPKAQSINSRTATLCERHVVGLWLAVITAWDEYMEAEKGSQ